MIDKKNQSDKKEPSKGTSPQKKIKKVKFNFSLNKFFSKGFLYILRYAKCHGQGYTGLFLNVQSEIG